MHYYTYTSSNSSTHAERQGRSLPESFQRAWSTHTVSWLVQSVCLQTLHHVARQKVKCLVPGSANIIGITKRERKIERCVIYGHGLPSRSQETPHKKQKVREPCTEIGAELRDWTLIYFLSRTRLSKYLRVQLAQRQKKAKNPQGIHISNTCCAFCLLIIPIR
jgi:hypothetical protein